MSSSTKDDCVPTILIVDDDEAICFLLGQFLSQQDFHIITANDVQQALDALDESSIDLILLDLHMPGPRSGEDLLFLLRDQGNEVPIIIVSGWVDDEATIHHPECVHGVLKKPVRKDNLISMVRQVLP